MNPSAWTWKRIKWSLRKARVPVRANGLVLDVGSGSNPHPAADVLLERFLDPKHRYGPMVADRPTVLGDACRMPFRDKVFDYVVAFHVLEHVPNPAAFLREMQRVSKAGYIETPNALFERLVPYDVHLLEIMDLDGTLYIHRKDAARPDPFINGLDVVNRSPKWRKLFYANPDLFHVRYFWNDEIRFIEVNPETSVNWLTHANGGDGKTTEIINAMPITSLRSVGLSLLRRWYRLRKHRKIDLSSLLACPECRGPLIKGEDTFTCRNCVLCYSAAPLADFTTAHVA